METVARRPFNKKRQLETDLAKVSQEMYRRNLELAETNQTLSLLRTIDNLVLEAHKDTDVLCQNIATAIIAHSHYTFVAMFASLPHKDYLELLGWATPDQVKLDEKSYTATIKTNHKWLINSERNISVDLRTVTD